MDLIFKLYPPFTHKLKAMNLEFTSNFSAATTLGC